MSASPGFADHLREHLAGLGGLSLRRLFGSTGVFSHGVMFGLVKDDVLFLRVDAANQADFAAEGGEPFRYMRAGKVAALAYWSAPERLLDEPEELRRWAGAALGAAHRVAAGRVAVSGG
jgi:DNA transformation protein